MFGDIKFYTPVVKFSDQEDQPVQSRDINIADASGIDDNLPGIWLYGREDVILESVNVGKKEVAAEAVDQGMPDGIGMPVAADGMIIALTWNPANESGRRVHASYCDFTEGQEAADDNSFYGSE